MMNTITFNFHRGDAFISKAVRAVSRGFFNHVSMTYNGHVYEAHMFVGVIKTPVAEWDCSTVHTTLTFKVKKQHQAELLDFLEAQVGKGYDYLGLLNFVLVSTKEREGMWYCSEFAKVGFAKAIGFKNAGQYSQRESPSSSYNNMLMVHSVMK